MTSGKSCLRCAKPLPADSVSELCRACTPGQAAETPEELKPIPKPPEDSPQAGNPFDETQTHPNPEEQSTDAAGGGRFNTGNANSDEDDLELAADQIKIAGYTLVSELGRGGCGIVFEAVQTKTKRRVAVKILLGQSIAERIRFDREMRALGKIKDPRVIDVYEAGECNAGPFFCMEHMEGGSLAQRLRTDGPMEPKTAAVLMESVARGVSTVHSAGLFHRDLKPGNILLDAEGNPKIADFGLAKVYEAGADATTAAKISATRGIYGTPAFMAPEQAARRNSDVDARTDVYGMGGILYQCLTGKAPFANKDEYRLLERVIYERPTDPSAIRSGIPKILEAICLKCLEKHPDARYQSALDLANDLAAWQRGEDTIARPATRLQRTGRWLNRQRRTMLIGGLVLASAATINMAGAWLKGKPDVVKVEVPADTEVADPDAELKKIIEEMKTGEKVFLVGETGKPRYYYPSKDRTNFITSRYADNPCTIETSTEHILNLLQAKDLPEAFEFEADVRHEIANTDVSRAGITLGEWNATTVKDKQLQFFQRIAFNDVSLVFLPAGAINNIQYQACVTKLEAGKLSWTELSNMAGMPIKILAPFTPSPWRHLKYIVLRNKVTVAGNATDPAFTPKNIFSNEEIKTGFRAKVNTEDEQTSFETIGDFDYSKRSVGLYILKGVASFKNVTIRSINSK